MGNEFPALWGACEDLVPQRLGPAKTWSREDLGPVRIRGPARAWVKVWPPECVALWQAVSLGSCVMPVQVSRLFHCATFTRQCLLANDRETLWALMRRITIFTLNCGGSRRGRSVTLMPWGRKCHVESVD